MDFQKYQLLNLLFFSSVNFFVKQYLDDGVMKIEHCPTKEMLADILTKPLVGEHFRILRDMLLGYK